MLPLEASAAHIPQGKTKLDTLSPARRSQLMSRIRGANTLPERRVRSAAHKAGYRFRLHYRSLPGTPDLVFLSRKTALFVHGCFWHRHKGCKLCYSTKSHRKYWQKKFKSNVARDLKAEQELQIMGWRVAIIWQCETSDPEALRAKLDRLLSQ